MLPFVMFPIASSTVQKRLDVGKEYVRYTKDFTKDCGFELLDSSKMSDDEIHTVCETHSSMLCLKT